MYINTRTYIFNNKAKFTDFYLYYKINYNFVVVTRNLCMLHNFTLHNFKVSGVTFNIDFLCSFLLYVESFPFSSSFPPPLPVKFITLLPLCITSTSPRCLLLLHICTYISNRFYILWDFVNSCFTETFHAKVYL